MNRVVAEKSGFKFNSGLDWQPVERDEHIDRADMFHAIYTQYKPSCSVLYFFLVYLIGCLEDPRAVSCNNQDETVP